MSSKSKFSLRIDDVMCIACRGILIKPVTMPCNHSLCLECFERTIECNTLTCPYCRKRMGSWVRAATKGKKLINELFWSQIQAKFPVQIEKKLKGEDDGIEDIIINQERPARILVSEPGALLEEFRSLSRQVEEELRREREKEELASLELIKKLQEQENEKEAARRLELEILKKRDEEIAKKLLSENDEEEALTDQDAEIAKKLSENDTETARRCEFEAETSRKRDKEIAKTLWENDTEAARRLKLEAEMLRKRDEEIAKKLMAVKFEKSPATEKKIALSSGSKNSSPKAGSSSSGKKPKVLTGPLDVFVRSRDKNTPVSGSSKEEYNQFRPIKPSPVTPTKSPPSRQIVIPQKVKPLSCQSFFGETSPQFSSSPPKPTILNSSFSSERCAFAATSATKAKEQLSEDITAANNSLTNLSVESDNSETDFEEDSNDSTNWKSGKSSVKASVDEKLQPKSSSETSTSRNKFYRNVHDVSELKELEDDIVRSYCKLSEGLDSNHLVSSKENELGTSKKVDNQSNFYPFSHNSKQLYAYLEEQVLEDYKLALKLQEELDKENVANKRLERNYELRKRPLTDLSPEKPSNKKQKLGKTSGVVSKQRTIEEAFQLKSSQ